MEAEIGIIGGTGVYDPKLLKNAKEIKISTPYGKPSDIITLGTYQGRKLAILPRHGKRHSINPSNINYRANIWALKKLGVVRILAPCAVGSLQDKIKPGQFVFVDQFIDKTTGRQRTFYDKDKVCHISVADPTCPELSKLLIKTATELKLSFWPKGTYVCIEGPRFSTRAESRLFRSWGGDVIGMTMVPECVLAREAEICYTSIAMVTDYDTFKEQAVNIQEVLSIVKKNTLKLKNMLTTLIPKIPAKRNCPCKDALKEALL